MEQPISVRRRILCFPIYVAMIGGGVFLGYEKLEGLRFKGISLAAGVLFGVGVYLMWADIIRPLFGKKP